MVATAAHERRGFVRHGALTWRDYFTFNTDHKVIGIQYMVIVVLLLHHRRPAGEADPHRAGRARHNSSLAAARYNQLFTIHGTIMIFLWIIPVLTGVANYVVPAAARRAGHGLPAAERSVLLAAASPAASSCWPHLPAGRRGERLDRLSAA